MNYSTFFHFKVKHLATVLCFLFSLGSAYAQVSGTVFRDYNANGTKDTNEPLVTGVTVNAYSSTGVLCGTTLTTAAAAPNYSLTGCGTSAVRIEFVIPLTGNCLKSGMDFSALSGATYGSSVQFVNGNSTNVNFALNNPVDYNIGITNTNVFVPCYVNGDPLPSGSASGAMDWFVGFPYSNTGTTVPTQKLTGEIIGAIWGVAYSKQANKIFTSAFIKRHVGLGTLGSGGIYVLTPTANSFTAATFFDMDNNTFNTAGTPVTRTRAEASAPAYGNTTSYQLNATFDQATFLGSNDPLTGLPSGLGVIGTNVERGLLPDPMQWHYDPAAFDQIGKVGLGGLEISDDGKYLFTMNLYSRKVFRLTLNNAFNPTNVIAIEAYNLPDPNCTNGVFRPFALKYYRGKLLIGGVCSAENGGKNIINGGTDMYAYVYELNNPTGAAVFNPTALISYPLNYRKGPVRDTQSGLSRGDFWLPWSGRAGDAMEGNTRPTPMLTDIEFTDNGDLIMNYTDRSGHQWGDENYKFLGNQPWTTSYMVGGDILIAGQNCSTGTFTLENNGSFTSANGQTYNGGTTNNEGPGGGEFFTGEDYRIHRETSQGSVIVLRGSGEAFITTMDPQTWDSGGLKRLSTTTGTELPSQWSGYELYKKFPFAGKSNGLGEVELSGQESFIEIGNRVWEDIDNDGVQDAGEPPISGIAVTLCASDGTTVLSTAITDTNGNYYFSSATGTSSASAIYGVSLAFNTNYILKFPMTSGNKTLTTKDWGGNDLIDSDAGLDGKIAFAVGTAGQNNHSYDAGYAVVPCSVPDCLGATVKKN
ncbi:hypothetical protein GVN20_23920 [Runella sp. CRIBMP]|uniref:SdrD B-like domain-containing protein n=1 Tax=Runella sp. CRIBMP TaxID=2683261 RepID=UPI001413676B|nr:SdrD B-like domain-containing protein [Runella sp. CRIBMP]NBB22422.1 hypothetical protein [Runella sp. CRIBMP]